MQHAQLEQTRSSQLLKARQHFTVHFHLVRNDWCLGGHPPLPEHISSVPYTAPSVLFIHQRRDSGLSLLLGDQK